MSETLPAQADVLVIGGGPAGTIAAVLLKKAHPRKRIVLLERGEIPQTSVR